MIRGIIFLTNDVTFAQGRRELGLDVEVEHLVVHRAINDPGRVQPVTAQGTNKGLGAPVAKGRVIQQSLPAWCPAGPLGHVGLHGCFVDEGQSLQMVGHERLALRDPDAAFLGYVLTLLLKRLQVFFCASARGRAEPARPSRDGLQCHASPPTRRPVHRE